MRTRKDMITIKQVKRKTENWSHKNEGKPYTKDEDIQIWNEQLLGKSLSFSAKKHKRSCNGIKAKVYHIMENYGTDSKGRLRINGGKYSYIKVIKQRTGKWWDEVYPFKDRTKYVIALREKNILFYFLKQYGRNKTNRIANLIGRTQIAVDKQIDRIGNRNRTTLFDEKTKPKAKIKSIGITKRFCPYCGFHHGTHPYIKFCESCGKTFSNNERR